MNSINEHVLLVTTHHFKAAKLMLLVNSWIMIAYLGVLIGGGFWSIFFNVVDHFEANPTYRRLSRYLIDIAVPGRIAALLYGVVPILTAALLYAQTLYQASQTATVGVASSLFFVVPGLILLTVYRKTFDRRDTRFYEHIASGVAGLGAILAGTQILASSVALTHDPEKWPFVNNPYELIMFSWHSIGQFVYWIIISFAVTGCALLYFYFRDAEIHYTDTPNAKLWIRNFGAGLGLAGCLLLPVFWFWNTITLPVVSLCLSFYIASGAAIIALILSARMLYKTLAHQENPPSYRAFIVFLCVLFALTLSESFAREHAIRDYTLALTNQMQAEEEKMKAEIEAKLPQGTAGGHGAGGGAEAAVGGDAAKGKLLASQKGCIACHSIDGTKMAGPSWKGIYGHEAVVMVNGTEQKVKVDDAYIRESIYEPNLKIVKGFTGLMPSQKGQMTDADVAAIIAYIKTLK